MNSSSETCNGILIIQIILFLALAFSEVSALSIASVNVNQQHSHTIPQPINNLEEKEIDRPLLGKFGQSINERILNSKEGFNRFGLKDHYTSAETIPCLNMKCSSGSKSASNNEIRKAFTANDNIDLDSRSSGSGCSIIRLNGKDAMSVRGLVNFADRFFEGVDDDECNKKIKDVGVFRIANNVHAGFDKDVNFEGKMQVLYTKIIPGNENDDDLLLPLEVGDLVGRSSLRDAFGGMNTLFDISSQITSAVLGFDTESSNKLLDDCSSIREQSDGITQDDVSNSYQRLIRYLEPSQEVEEAAFWPHVDSTFLTLIPMPELPGLEVWCLSKKHTNSSDLSRRGE